MSGVKRTCFRDEIRKSLIVHALAPCILSLLALVAFFMAIGFSQIADKNIRARQRVSEEYEKLMNQYLDKNRQMSKEMGIREFEQSGTYRVEIISELYRFLNSQEYRGDFYLFGKDRNCLFSTHNDPDQAEYLSNYLTDCGNREMDELTFLYLKTDYAGDTLPAWFLYRPVPEGGEIRGYCGFVLPADQFAAPDAGLENVLITNRFNRIYTAGFERFENERGKLYEELRENQGLLRFEGKWYHLSHGWILNGAARVTAIYDCTSFIQLCAMSLITVALLAFIMVAAIYRSAGTVADKKTEIIYELIAALDKAEKGDLSVTVDICTGDEFESIGKSFNMMIGSIRHLIARHQELARENLLATVQILEAQFNPHFLFNTLESIRYMIKFEPRAAEKMIVSLSRLLRYSIHSGSDMAGLEDELRFIDQYLQIMLYRYGERLKYQIQAENYGKRITMPRMILQPLVENSIKYGFGDDREELTITVKTRLEDKKLLICIADDGVGIGQCLLEQLRNNLKQEQNQSEHIGLYNVDRRIKLAYGKDHGIQIESEEGGGTEITLYIPLDGGQPD